MSRKNHPLTADELIRAITVNDATNTYPAQVLAERVRGVLRYLARPEWKLSREEFEIDCILNGRATVTEDDQ